MSGGFGGARASGSHGDGGGGEAGRVTLLRSDSGARGHGRPGCDRSAAVGGFMAVRLHSRNRFGAGVSAALWRERAVPLAMRRSGGESSLAVGFPQRSWRGAGSVVYAGDCLAGGAGCGKGEPGESGRGAGADQCRGGQFPAGRAVAATAVGSPAARGGVAAPSGLARVRAVDSAAGGGAQAGCHREAATVGGSDCAAAGTEAEAGGSGAAGGPGQAWTEDPGATAAGERYRSGGAADEDAQRGI